MTTAFLAGHERHDGTGDQHGLEAGHAIRPHRETLSERRRDPGAGWPQDAAHGISLTRSRSRRARMNVRCHQGVRAAGPAIGRAGGAGHEGGMIVHVLAGAVRWSGIWQDKSDE